MKRQIAFACAALLCVGTLASCGSSVKDIEDYSLEDLVGYVTVGEYKGVSISETDIQSDVDDDIATVLSANDYDQETGAAAVDGNKVTVEYTATIDGEAKDELSSTKTITLGSGTIGIDEIDAALVGMSVGETANVTATVPDSFTGTEGIDGAEAVFTLNVTSVTENIVPTELTADMVNTYTEGEYTDVDSYEAYLYENAKETLAWSAVVDGCTLLGYPADLAESYYDSQISNYTSTASNYSMTLEQLVSAYGYDIDDFCTLVAQQAVAQVQQEVILNIIAKKENIVPTEEQISAKADEFMSDYGYEDLDTLYATVPKKTVSLYATYELVYKFLADNAVVTD